MSALDTQISNAVVRRTDVKNQLDALTARVKNLQDGLPAVFAEVKAYANEQGVDLQVGSPSKVKIQDVVQSQYGHTLIVMEDGSVLGAGITMGSSLGGAAAENYGWSWVSQKHNNGFGIHGQVIRNNTTDYSGEVALQVLPISDVKKAVAGERFTAFLKNDGTVWFMGDLIGGVLRSTPVQIADLPLAQDISAVMSFLLILTRDGDAFFRGDKSNESNIWRRKWVSSASTDRNLKLEARIPTSTLEDTQKNWPHSHGYGPFEFAEFDFTSDNAWAANANERYFRWNWSSPRKFKQIAAGPFHIVLLDTDNIVWAAGTLFHYYGSTPIGYQSGRFVGLEPLCSWDTYFRTFPYKASQIFAGESITYFTCADPGEADLYNRSGKLGSLYQVGTKVGSNSTAWNYAMRPEKVFDGGAIDPNKRYKVSIGGLVIRANTATQPITDSRCAVIVPLWERQAAPFAHCYKSYYIGALSYNHWSGQDNDGWGTDTQANYQPLPLGLIQEDTVISLGKYTFYLQKKDNLIVTGTVNYQSDTDPLKFKPHKTFLVQYDKSKKLVSGLKFKNVFVENNGVVEYDEADKKEGGIYKYYSRIDSPLVPPMLIVRDISRISTNANNTEASRDAAFNTLNGTSLKISDFLKTNNFWRFYFNTTSTVTAYRNIYDEVDPKSRYYLLAQGNEDLTQLKNERLTLLSSYNYWTVELLRLQALPVPIEKFGLNIFNSNNKLIYDSNSITWNQVDFFEVAANGSASKYYPFCVGKEMLVLQHFIEPPPVDRKMLSHTISAGNGSVSLSGGSERVHVVVLMR